MGNCLRRESEAECGGDDRDLAVKVGILPGKKVEHEKKIDDWVGDNGVDDFKAKQNFPTTTKTSATTEIKIKITKKQLEELLGGADVKGLSLQQVLTQLINVSDRYETHDQRSWRPALQSIPE
ncbi:DUF4228 domain protein [Quillaja saponaria]|uniref:DUF4228 domain protein n=1 Tax=Quillaja saponaria TaxID=32244 RepID=A0AAD7LMR2_QUISA|nr:DUF4228 domain protein [Quillaja saponaria]